MTSWQQGGPGAPPPAGFHIPNPGYPHSQQPGYPPPGYPPTEYPQGPPPPFGQPHFGYGQPTPAMYNSTESGYEDTLMGSNFSDKEVRRGFIRKVYSILMCQILVTIAIMAFFLFHEGTKLWIQRNSYMLYVFLGIVMFLMIVLACCDCARRTFPTNLVVLGIFTIFEGCYLGGISAFYGMNEVMLAMGITAVICLSLTLFAFQTKWDFTVMGAGLLIASVVLLLFGIISIFVHMKILNLIYCCIGAVLFSLYLVYDTQLMMGGKHKYSVSPEEYIFAALSLYVDIINIFIMILGIIGNSRD